MTDRNDGRPVVFRLNKHTRSRQGCQTCRSRKVKCGEEHPQCRNCVRAKRECIWTRPWQFRDLNTMLAQPCTVVQSRPMQASKVTDRHSNGMSNNTMSLDFGPRMRLLFYLLGPPLQRCHRGGITRCSILVCLLSPRLLILSVLLKLLLDCRTDHIGDYDRNEVLLTIMLLQISEPFSPISQAGGWISHVDGAAQMIKAEGPKPLNSPYETALFNHARQFTIIIGMLRREDIFFNQPQWLAITKSAPAAYHATTLLDIGSSIPGMLAETDKILANNSPEHVVYELLQKLDSTGEAVVTWITDFFSSMAHEISTTIDLKEMDSYNEEMNGDTTFLPVYKFASYRTAWNVTLGWVFHFAILKTIYGILSARTDIHYKLTAPELELEMFRVVTDLSMVIPQFFDRKFGAMGRAVIIIPLGLSTEFYAASGQTRKLEWCHRVAKAVYNPREGLEQIQKPGSNK
ncbi:hypothetical protein KCU65_g345, partial [Aureobasidium melanogenum]